MDGPYYVEKTTGDEYGSPIVWEVRLEGWTWMNGYEDRVPYVEVFGCETAALDYAFLMNNAHTQRTRLGKEGNDA